MGNLTMPSTMGTKQTGTFSWREGEGMEEEWRHTEVSDQKEGTFARPPFPHTVTRLKCNVENWKQKIFRFNQLFVGLFRYEKTITLTRARILSMTPSSYACVELNVLLLWYAMLRP